MSNAVDDAIRRALEANDRASRSVELDLARLQVGRATGGRHWLVAASIAVIVGTAVWLSLITLDGSGEPAAPGEEPRTTVIGTTEQPDDPHGTVTSEATSSLPDPDRGPVVVTVSDRPTVDPGIDYVTVRNVSDRAIDLSGWMLRTRRSAIEAPTFEIPDGVVLGPAESITVYETQTIGADCQPDTATSFFTCNAMGLDRTTRQVIFPYGPIELLDSRGTLVATTAGS